ncbi:MAG TPA: hypothetical protein VMU38_01995 [Candidatus Binatia bacterium]|nr:hypothetical protein [Candidatus Binatia bacterium]
MSLRRSLPQHHLADDSRRLLEIGLGTIGTMAGLVLGLLVASASASYSAQRDELLELSSKAVVLDRVLAHYGPSAEMARSDLRAGVGLTIESIWPAAGAPQRLEPLGSKGEPLFDAIEALAPKNDEQRSLKTEAEGVAIDLAQVRWLMFAQTGSAVSMPLLVLLIFWFTITFVGFGMFAPSNPTAVIALGLAALAVSGAIFIMVEMYTPFAGLVRLSSLPLREALEHLGR